MDRDTIWTRRSRNPTSESNTPEPRSEQSAPRNFGNNTKQRAGAPESRANPFNNIAPLTTGITSPNPGASSAFGLGSGTGAFASFGSTNKTPKTPGNAFDFAAKGLGLQKSTPPTPLESNDKKIPSRAISTSIKTADSSNEDTTTAKALLDFNPPCPLKHTWVIWYRPPTSKNTDYEKSMKPLCKIRTVQEFWKVYTHLKRPSALPSVSDYHFFKDGIRPVWEDEENKRGGKWILRLKKGVADRYWENLLLGMVGDQFNEAGEEVCGAVLSIRGGEDVFSVWTKMDGGRNVKIRETLKRLLSLPADTHINWKSHDDSIAQRSALDEARQTRQGTTGNANGTDNKRRSTQSGEDSNPQAGRA